MTWLGDLRDSDFPAAAPRPLHLAAVFVAGTLCALLPRLLVEPTPVYPDSVLYLYTAMLGEPHSHMVFRYLSVLPIWVASWFSDDIYVVCRIHGCLMAAGGVLALCALCRTLMLSLVETLLVCLLFAASPDAIGLSGWAPLTDVTYAIAVTIAAAAYVAWARGRLPSVVAGILLGALLGHRLSGGFVLLGFVLLCPWRSRGLRQTVILAAACGGSVVAYLLVTGLVVAGDPLWGVYGIADLYDLGQIVQRRRDRTLNNVAGVLIDPRALGPLLLALVVGLHKEGKRFRPVLWCAAFVLLSYDVFDAMSDNLAVRSRRFPALVFLCFPMAAVFLRRHLGTWLSIAGCAAVFAVSAGVSSGAELLEIDWPYPLDAGDTPSKTKWLLVLVWSAGLLSVALRRPAFLALAVVAAIAVRGALDLHWMIHFYRPRAPTVARIAEPEGTCPEAIVQRHVAFSEMLGHLNRLHNGPCTKLHYVERKRDVRTLDLKAPVVFSQFKQIPGYTPSGRMWREWRFRRFTRIEPAPEND